MDTFVFDTSLSATANVDKILDFSTVDDAIQLENAIFTRLWSTGQLASSAFKNTGSGTINSSDRIIYDKASGALAYDADGSGQGAAIKCAELAPGLDLTYQDFFVI